jgi:hypothetical protein
MDKLPHPLEKVYEELKTEFMPAMQQWLLDRYESRYGDEYDYSHNLVSHFANELTSKTRATLRERKDKAFAERLSAYVTEHNLVEPETIAQRHGIPLKALRDLWERNLIPGHWPPMLASRSFRAVYFDADLEIDAETLGQAQLTRRAAAEWLGISPGKFDRLKRKLKIEHVDSFPSRSGYPAYLYSLADLEGMRLHIDPGKRLF